MERRPPRKPAGRNRLARLAHFRTSGGAMGGTRTQLAKRRRRKDREEERQAERDRPTGDE
jgi:hypothetical protein